jgi:hypothetical protein
MEDKRAQLIGSRDKLIQQTPILPPSCRVFLLSRTVRCNKTGRRFCEKGKGHGAILILSVSPGDGRVRQVQVPDEIKGEVEDSLRAFAQTQDLLKQIAGMNFELLRERKGNRE